ncbi:MAG: COX15/CtaA family protein [Flavobacterium sp.]|nr:COX15/CtaA family protein [Flavobacterium sp.]
MKSLFLKFAKTSLILVYIVIIAGALVRMTGSGMGCPDWPKCFGYYIPPTDIKELTWSPNREFESGQVIIKDEALLVAKDNFTTGTTFDVNHWRPYTKHDYAIFNPTHTWIEYLNRLAGLLGGFAVLFMAVFSFAFWKGNKKIVFLSWLVVIMMGIQGWLGATVVYSVLNPIKITLHMIVALLIVAVLLFTIRKAATINTALKIDNTFRNVVILTLLLTLIQIALGTQVRQFVDNQGHDNLLSALENPPLNFYIHRSFSILIFGLNFFLYHRNKKLELGFSKINWVMAFIVVEFFTGILMYYFNFPFGTQPLHLVIAALLFGVQFYLYMETKKQNSVTI